MTFTTRVRWRALSAAGITAAVTAGILMPPAMPAHAAASKAGYTVTVQAPGPHSPAGEIASGTINGQGWQIVRQKQCPGSSMPCITFAGAALDGAGSSTTEPLSYLWVVALSRTGPAAFAAVQPLEGGAQLQYGPVKANVAAVKVRLTNGAVLTLHPVTLSGTRAVGFGAPGGATIVSATAYTSDGREISTAVPFGQPGLASQFTTWYQPGQHGPARADGVIGSGHGWTARGYVGPYGLCFVYEQSDACSLAAPKRGISVDFQAINGSPPLAMGVTAPGVVRLTAKLAGKTTQVHLVKIGGQKFFSVVTPAWDSNFSWIAYYANGTKVTGTG